MSLQYLGKHEPGNCLFSTPQSCVFSWRMWVAACMWEGQRSSLWTFATDRFCSEPPTFSTRRHMPNFKSVASREPIAWVRKCCNKSSCQRVVLATVQKHKLKYFGHEVWARILCPRRTENVSRDGQGADGRKTSKTGRTCRWQGYVRLASL